MSSFGMALSRINDIEAQFGMTPAYTGENDNGFGTTLQKAVDRISTGGPQLLNNPVSGAKTPTNNQATPTTFSPVAGAYSNSSGGGYSTVSQVGSSSPIPPGSGLSAQLNATFDAASEKYGVPANLAKAIGKAESNYRANAQSAAGAQGIMQLMPSTASGLGVTNPMDPAQSIDAGTKYLGELLQRFGGNQQLAVAAYNAGPNAVAKYDGVPPYPETQAYVTKVLGYAAQFGGTSDSDVPSTDPITGTVGALGGS